MNSEFQNKTTDKIVNPMWCLNSRRDLMVLSSHRSARVHWQRA